MTVDHEATVVTRQPEVPEERPVEVDSRAGRSRRSRDHPLGLALQAVLVGIAGCVLAAVVVGWDPRQWRVYFSYEGDTFFNAINGVEATPVGVTNVSTHLGWPYGMNLIDFPAGEPLFTWFQWFVHLFVGDQFTVLAALWFLGFFGVGAVTYLVMRGLGLGLWSAVASALVYDFVPFHLWRAFGHTNLALYMAVPLGLMVLLWLMTGRLDRPRRDDPDWRPLWRTPDWWVVAVSAVVIGLSARYYAVFFLLLLTLVTVGRLLVQRQLRSLWSPLLIGGSTLGIALLTGIPQALQILSAGGNSEVAQRPRTDSDLYALRLTDLFAPIPDHRIEALRQLSEQFHNTLVRGEDSSSMGWFLLAGFVFLVVVAVSRRALWRPDDHAPTYSVGLGGSALVLAGLSFLIGTVGGLGGVIASLGYTQIRSWNRISIEITFCAALGLGMALSWLWQLRKSRVPWRRLVPVVVTPLVLALAILDQTGSSYPTQSDVAAARSSDLTFFRSMADDLGTGSAVFQLPYVSFPESGGLALDYAGFRGYLNDGGRLNYSYGGMRGRESDWQRTWATMEPQVQVVGLAAARFDAVLVDRVGYTAENSIEPRLSELLGPPRSTSPDGRFAWYDLRPVRDRLLAAKGADWMTSVGARVIRPIGVQVRSSTFRSNGVGAVQWGSLGAASTMQLRRYDDDVAPVTLQFRVETAAGGHVTVSSDGSQSIATSTGEPVDVTRPVSMQPTVATVEIALDAPNTAKITDPWPDLRGQLYEVRVVDAELAEQIAKGELAIPR
jgi:phosphoglycerol transferase